MKKALVLIIFMTVHVITKAQNLYTANDSVRVEALLASADGHHSDANMLLFFARKFKDVPYVGQTLEHLPDEHLVINLSAMDCTTFVETVLALYLCHREGKKTFRDYCYQLQNIRYWDGKVDYAHRLHYFTQWIKHNHHCQVVDEIQQPDALFKKVQQIKVNYMSTYPQKYPMLKLHPQLIPQIRLAEQKISGTRCRYISKYDIRNDSLTRAAIKDGDLLAMVTSKQGLDTSHIGIAVWHEDGLHMINASLIHRRVVEDEKTLKEYMMGQRTQIGVRVIRVIK